MAVNIDLKSEALKEDKGDSHIQYLPCNIEYDGKADINKFFNIYVDEEVTGDGKEEKTGLKGMFRGYPLRGCVAKVPEGYKGVVLKETRPTLSADEDRTMRGVCQFKSFTFWNWDREPSRGDRYQQAMDWIDVANAIHGSDN
ncbi:ribonuclease H2 subunit C-like [Homarus americanus]|uniref:ribonuclease H2 subunit C-like n=1 Tax=Homarus americanus TaxID=6706 RepID=UPI001C48FBD6|nr:ribonuclease H2 subunit C-like [Homarus americanus]